MTVDRTEELCCYGYVLMSANAMIANDIIEEEAAALLSKNIYQSQSERQLLGVNHILLWELEEWRSHCSRKSLAPLLCVVLVFISVFT